MKRVNDIVYRSISYTVGTPIETKDCALAMLLNPHLYLSNLEIMPPNQPLRVKLQAPFPDEAPEDIILPIVTYQIHRITVVQPSKCG